MTEARTLHAPDLGERIEYYEQFEDFTDDDVCRLVARDLTNGAGEWE